MDGPLSPELLAEVTKRAKVQIRKRMKAVRQSHPAAALAQRSAQLVERAKEIPGLAEARGVALYWPLVERGEIDLRALDAWLRERGVRVYYPFMEPKDRPGAFRTGFRLSASADDVILRGRTFAEPPPDAPDAKPGDVDFVFVPALAADGRGHRIGYGAGYYDATLADVRPPARAVIVVYEFQLLAEIPIEPHDVPCDVVLTDRRWLTADAGAVTK